MALFYFTHIRCTSELHYGRVYEPSCSTVASMSVQQLVFFSSYSFIFLHTPFLFYVDVTPYLARSASYTLFEFMCEILISHIGIMLLLFFP